ncbi:MAG: hypothetical protein IJ590_02830 [Rickettsiales bacterium]|nr:hypothetical protein [Rickettsiales bacterium]
MLIVALGGARLADEERGAAKQRGRGRGRRNINQWRFLAEHLKVHLYILSLVRLIFLKEILCVGRFLNCKQLLGSFY